MLLEWILTFYISQMDSPKFSVRDHSHRCVERIILDPNFDSPVIQTVLNQTIKNNPELETRLRCQYLLTQYRNIPNIHNYRVYAYDDWQEVCMEAFGHLREQAPLTWDGQKNYEYEEVNRAVLNLAFKHGSTRTVVLKYVKDHE